MEEADVVVEWRDVEEEVVVRKGRFGWRQFLPLTRISGRDFEDEKSV